MADLRHPGYPKNIPGYWDICNENHIWKETDSMYSNEYSTNVECIKCGVSGEQDRETLDVYWPTT